MKVKDLLVSNLNISEDQYSYKGIFSLSHLDKSLNVDLAELETDSKLNEIKNCFELEESTIDIKTAIISMVVAKATISSRIAEGESYQEGTERKSIERTINALDMA